MDKRKVIFSNRFEKEKLDDYSTNLETDNAIAPTFSEANDFLKFIQKNRRSVPSKERIADKDKFIKTVYELSNSFEIDADLIEFAEGYTAKIYVDYAGGYDKTEKGTSLAEKHYSAGAKVIYHAAGGTGNGVFAAAKDRAKKGEKVWVIGVDSDQFSTGIYDKKENKSVTLTSALKRVDAVTEAVSKSVLDNKFKAGLQTYDSSNDGVGLPDENPNLSDDIKKAVEDASAKIKSGEIKVSAERTIAPGSNG